MKKIFKFWRFSRRARKLKRKLHVIQASLLAFLQYILQQEETSVLCSMLRAQEERPTKGGWFSETQKNIQELKKLAWNNLQLKQKKGKKGKYIDYVDQLQMADYLQPNSMLNLKDQILMFQIRSETNPLPANRGDPGPCPMNCKNILDNLYILMCVILNQEDQTEYTLFLNGNMNQIKLNLKK